MKANKLIQMQADYQKMIKLHSEIFGYTYNNQSKYGSNQSKIMKKSSVVSKMQRTND